MKKKISILLSLLLIITMPCVAQLSASALPSGTTIYLNAYEAGWDNAYIYGWDCGLEGEFIQMEKTPHQGIYSFTLPQQSPDGMIYFYFTDRNTWDGQERTESLSTQAGKNFYTIYDKDGYGKWTGRWSYVAPVEPTEPPTEPPTLPPTEPPTETPYVIAPTSTIFSNSMEITIQTNCSTATYAINSGAEITFTGSENLILSQDTDLVLRGYGKNGARLCSESYVYRMVEYPSGDNVIPSGTAILFDNASTQWSDVYIYGWKYGFYGEFLEMTRLENTNLYYYILPESVPVGVEFCLFVNQNSWAGAAQTKNIAFSSNNVNTVVPAAGTSPLNYTWAYSTPPVVNYVSATPSKTFAESINVVLYTNCEIAEYSINGAASVEYFDGTVVTIGGGAAVGTVYNLTLLGISADGSIFTADYTYTKTGKTTITATVTGYDGPVYAYLFGGNRIGGAFYLMDKDAVTGVYSYQFEGASQVIFTTTDDWATAVKLNTDEPLVAAGSTNSFELAYPIW